MDTNGLPVDLNGNPTTFGGIGMGGIVDARFLKKNKDFLYDPNSLKRQDLDDEKSCAIADSILNACNDIIDAAQLWILIR